MKFYIISIVVVMFSLISWTYSNLEYKGYERVHGCTGECYEQYVAEFGTPAQIEQRKQAVNATDEFSSIRGLWAGCAACHGPDGGGGIGPMLAGQSSDDIINKLTIYKNNGTIGPQSALMWGQAGMLSDQDIKTLGEFIQETMK